jgi:DNA-binding XRE family transcriptional regulator
MKKREGWGPAGNREKTGSKSEALPARLSVGALFKIHRKEAGITQLALAERAGVDERTIRLLEGDGHCSARMQQDILTALNALREPRYSALRLLTYQATPTLEIAPWGWLEMPSKHWVSHYHGPGALLTANYGVVPFHGTTSHEELAKLIAWCHEPRRLGIRIYKGPGGMGKTRLALELCRALRDVKTGTIWSTGFGRLKGFPAERSPWEALPDLRKPLLVVVDYAGEARKTQMMTQLLGHLDACPAPKVRLLFLERDDRWLDRLHEDPAAREILLGPLLSKAGEAYAHKVAPVAVTATERNESFNKAATAFKTKLEAKALAQSLVSLSGELYNRVLFLHMQALLTVLGSSVQRSDAILRHLLAREHE